MSIIYEALKKTQSRLMRKENIIPAPPSEPSPSAQGISPSSPAKEEIISIPQAIPKPFEKTRKPPVALWLATSGILGGFIFCGAVAVFLIYSSGQLTALTAKTDQLAGKNTAANELVKILAKPKMTAAAPSIAKPNQSPAPAPFTLNGIISTGDEQLALINNQILKAGDYIDGKRVVSISPDKVEIFDKGEIITLTTAK